MYLWQQVSNQETLKLMVTADDNVVTVVLSQHTCSILCYSMKPATNSIKINGYTANTVHILTKQQQLMQVRSTQLIKLCWCVEANLSAFPRRAAGTTPNCFMNLTSFCFQASVALEEGCFVHY